MPDIAESELAEAIAKEEARLAALEAATEQVQCGECPNQAFIAIDDRVVVDHLQGRHVIGVYPMLENETCWFLAADFDKSSWRDDVAAFAETARGLNVSVAVERSRSGNGAHAWLFFSSPVGASVARKMGASWSRAPWNAHLAPGGGQEFIAALDGANGNLTATQTGNA